MTFWCAPRRVPTYSVVVHKYRSLFAWQQAHKIAVLALTKCDSAYHPRSKALFDQLRRAAISVEAKVVEGYALGTTLQFRRHAYRDGIGGRSRVPNSPGGRTRVSA